VKNYTSSSFNVRIFAIYTVEKSWKNSIVLVISCSQVSFNIASMIWAEKCGKYLRVLLPILKIKKKNILIHSNKKHGWRFLKQASRDAFLIDLLEQTGKNIQAKQKGEKTEDGLGESPFAFKPREDRLAMFHAFATKVLKQEPSQYYQYAHDYLKPKAEGGPGYEQWQFLGLQGLADITARLETDNNEDLLIRAIPEMPELPMSSYAQSLENVEYNKPLFDALMVRINSEIASKKADVILIASLIRAISSFPDNTSRIKLLISILESSLANEVEIYAAISGRCWRDLEEAKLLDLFLKQLALQEKVAFNAIIADLIMIPNMRELILAAVRREDPSSELVKQFDSFTQKI